MCVGLKAYSALFFIVNGVLSSISYAQYQKFFVQSAKDDKRPLRTQRNNFVKTIQNEIKSCQTFLYS